MDPLGALLAATALLVFPGGLFLVAAAAGAGWGRRPAAVSWAPEQVAGTVLAAAAVALAPLPGSPAQLLPPDGGAPGNLTGALLLLAAGIALAAPSPWSPARVVTGIASAAAGLAPALAASSLALPTLVAVPGTAMAFSRGLAALALLVAAPILVPPDDPALPGPARTVVIASPAMLALSLVLPAALPALPAGAVGVAALAGTALHGRLVRRLDPWMAGHRAAGCALVTGAAAAAVALGLLT